LQIARFYPYLVELKQLRKEFIDTVSEMFYPYLVELKLLSESIILNYRASFILT